MEEKVDWENILTPAIYDLTASGREQKPCELCKEGFRKGDRKIEFVDGAFRGTLNFSRFHYKCFLKVLAMKFPELLKDDFKNGIIKEVVIESIK